MISSSGHTCCSGCSSFQFSMYPALIFLILRHGVPSSRRVMLRPRLAPRCSSLSMVIVNSTPTSGGGRDTCPSLMKRESFPSLVHRENLASLMMRGLSLPPLVWRGWSGSPEHERGISPPASSRDEWEDFSSPGSSMEVPPPPGNSRGALSSAAITSGPLAMPSPGIPTAGVDGANTVFSDSGSFKAQHQNIPLLGSRGAL
mmetsp:Transcript_125067/g.353991  ORF Transcript_125067/g.353991 Transcript_125067/m.353991 type:complete len:201 (-) Transcript_125067:44-646(-)